MLAVTDIDAVTERVDAMDALTLALVVRDALTLDDGVTDTLGGAQPRKVM